MRRASWELLTTDPIDKHPAGVPYHAEYGGRDDSRDPDVGETYGPGARAHRGAGKGGGRGEGMSCDVVGLRWRF